MGKTEAQDRDFIEIIHGMMAVVPIILPLSMFHAGEQP